MATYKITALKDVSVSAYVWYRGTRPTARDHQGSQLPPMAAMKNESQSFDLEQGESREDISFLETVDGSICTTVLPEKLNEEVMHKDLLSIVRISHDKPSL